MLRKTVKAVIVSFAISIVPAFGKMRVLEYPHLWILCGIGIISLLLQPDYHLGSTESAGYDKGTERQIIWSVLATQLFVILEAVYIRFPDSFQWSTTSTIVLAFILAGVVLRSWAVLSLGPYFTMHLDVHPKHALVQTGPYRFVRHPSYVGAFLVYGATPLLLNAWYSLVPTLIVLSSAWLRRIGHEERMLRETFGEAYELYCRGVKKVIPGIW